MKLLHYKILALCLFLFANGQSQDRGDSNQSMAFERYKSSDLSFDQINPYLPHFTFFLTTGLGYFGSPETDEQIQGKLDIFKNNPDALYIMRLPKQNKELTAAHYLRSSIDGFKENTTFRDPSSPIKVGGTYHIWYSKTWGTPPVGQEKGSQESYHEIKGEWKRIYSWDFVSIWHATSKDGYHWEEQDMALEPGQKGSYDDRCVFTPDILVADGKYYLYYQVATSPHVYRHGPHQIAMAWAESPEGPWHKTDEPVLVPSSPGHFDSRKVHDPCVIHKGDQYYLYYKGHGQFKEPKEHGEDFYIGWGVAIADKPEGPFVKSELNPVVVGGHEVMIFPYKSGVCGMVYQGPESYTLQYAEDGLNFDILSHVTNVPEAGSFFRQGHFKDIDKYPAKLPTWGLCHDYRLASPETFIVRYNITFPQNTHH